MWGYNFMLRPLIRKDFRLAKLVKQDCPLAPYLFILATNVLDHMLDDPKHEIEGLHLPKGGCVRDTPPSSLLDPKRVQLCQIAEEEGTWCRSQLPALKGVRGAC